MKVLVIDPYFGAAGDMILGALLSLGADENLVRRAVSKVSDPEIKSSVRCGVDALYVQTKTGKHNKTIEDIYKIIDGADAPKDAKDLAKKVFSRVAKAESAVHKTEHVHFHEVGADDAVADILGSCTALLSLNVDAVFVKPVSLGSGTLKCAHGIMPVPAPATLEILKDSDLKVTFNNSFDGELCTPTGAALLSEFADSFNKNISTGKILKSGCGAGSRNPDDHPNILRAYITESDGIENTVDILETNVDDISGEVLSHALSVIIREGARDASAVPAVMKKGRAGYLIKVICMPEDSVRLSKILAKETGSLGIRCMPMIHRFAADRVISKESAEINGTVYTADVKSAYENGIAYSKKAEFDDCKVISEKSGVPLKDVKRMFEEKAWKVR
ncbi:MAG TPA: nickel pincer cofactor biosynthesis protein LarC [Methanocorpusculum sp.]|nr:nickel pincer cofactor biosynthesis protein LarC [Methanocorpusculum sp.]